VETSKVVVDVLRRFASASIVHIFAQLAVAAKIIFGEQNENN